MGKPKPGTEIAKVPESMPTAKKLRISTKQVREYEVVVSDRAQLVNAANDFVEHMIYKQIVPALTSSVPVDIPVSDQELQTYDAALSFLKRQFEVGYVTTEPVEKRIENEQTEEVQQN